MLHYVSFTPPPPTPQQWYFCTPSPKGHPHIGNLCFNKYPGLIHVSLINQEVAGEPLYVLFRAIKYQVDKGPVDVVTGKAKRTLNDSHLLRDDIDYSAMVITISQRQTWKTALYKENKELSLFVPLSQTLNVMVKNGVEVHQCPVKVLDIDTITQVRSKMVRRVPMGWLTISHLSPSHPGEG